MKKVAFIVDTSCNCESFNLPNVYYLPFEISFIEDGIEKSEKDYVEFKDETVKRLISKNILFKTAQVAPIIIEELIIKLLAEYEKVICIPISKHLSSQFESFTNIRKKLIKTGTKKESILIIDSLGLGPQISWFINSITKMIDNNLKNNKIEDEIKKINKNSCGFVIINNVSRLISSGRISGVKAFLVKTLNLKLVIRWQDGFLKLVDKNKNKDIVIKLAVEMVVKKLDLNENKLTDLAIMSDKLDANENIVFVKKLLGVNDKKLIAELFPSIIVGFIGSDYFGIILKSESNY